MIFPNCGSKLSVAWTNDLLDVIERNRRCPNCGKYYKSVEVLKRSIDRDEASAKKRGIESARHN